MLSLSLVLGGGVRAGAAPAPECAASPTGQPLSVWAAPGTAIDAIRPMIETFTASHPDTPATVSFVGSEGDIRARLRRGERPDVLIQSVDGMVNFADAGIVTPVAACVAADAAFDVGDVLPVALATYALAGVQQAMPLAVSTPVLYFDQRRFRQAGLDPTHPPGTVAELESTVHALMTAGGATQGLVYGQAKWFLSNWAAQAGIEVVGAGNGHDDPASATIRLDQPAVRQLLAEVGRLASQGLIAPPQPTPDGIADLLALISSDNPAALDLHTSASASAAYELAEASAGDGPQLGIAPLPGPGTAATVGGVGAWITSAAPAGVWSAWQLISYLSAADQQAALGELGYAPARRSATGVPSLQQAWAARPGLRVAFDVLSATSVGATSTTAVIGPPFVLDWRINSIVEDVIAGGRTVDAAVTAGQRDLERLLRTYDEMRQVAAP